MPLHPAEKYAHDIRDRKATAGKLVQLAVDRYFDDLENGISRGLYFNKAKATKACTFFPKLLKHSKGKWSGKPFELEPWQQFLIWNLFGWENANGTRRFKIAYIQVARKNGKSTLASGIGLKMMIADGEHGAEVYVGATKKPQAYITFSEAQNMVRKSPALSEYITVFRHNLHSLQLNAKFEPLASDSDKQDGLSPYCGIIDEYHAHRTDALYNVLESGMGARTNPLMFVITTAGFNRHSPCYAMRDVCIKILNGTIQQDEIFTLIYEMDDDDDWEDPANWPKANPSMATIDTILPFLQSRYSLVKNDPTKYVDFLTKNLNRWMDASEVWIEDARWMENADPVTIDDLRGLSVYAAIDLSSTTDITAVCFIANDGNRFLILPHFFVPKLTAEQRVKKDGVPYDLWIRQGYITETEGDVVDYDAVRKYISGYHVLDGVVCHDPECMADQLNIVRVGFDKWNSSQLVNDLVADGIEMSEFRQGFASMSAPTKEFKKLALKRQLAHGANPVLRWMVSNVEIKRDPAGNEKPDKGSSSEKIDGAVAAIMALGEYLTDNATFADIFTVRTT
ncbi:MAG: terminase large subunit [Marinilabiliaceae bacterium]|nr:terminase large subunit [Marinilabiliaceae bacterium]